MTTGSQSDNNCVNKNHSTTALSLLDRRRQKMQSTDDAAESARVDVDDLDKQLDTNAGKTGEHEASLPALDHVAALKKVIRAANKQSDKLKIACNAARG